MKKLFVIVLFAIISISASAQSGTVASVDNKNEIQFTIVGETGGVISKEELMKADSLECRYGLKVLSFTMSRIGKGKDPIDVQQLKNGNKLSQEMKQIIAETNSGDKIFFENIKVEGTSTEQAIKPLVFKIK